MYPEHLLRKLIRETLVNLSGGTEAEYGSPAHIVDIQKTIDDIMRVKDSLRRGPDRNKNRKEVNQLQSAVKALRFLLRKAERDGRKSGLIKEGGLKAPHLTGHVKLDSQTVSSAIERYETVIGMWNSYLQNLDPKVEPVTLMGPVGSSAYYLSDTPSTEYGDVDFLISLPVGAEEAMGPADTRKVENAAQRKYKDLLRDFLNTSVDIEDYVNTAATNVGSPFLLIVRLPNGDHVQVDTIVTYPQYSPGAEGPGWMPGRWIPEQGFKGYTIGNLYVALGNYFDMSIGDRGVSARMIDGQRVSSRKTSAELITISTDIRTFLRDIAKEVGGEDIIENELLSTHPGVNPSDVKIQDLASGIKGLALTLSDSGIIESSHLMLDSVLERYETGLQKNIESKKARGLSEDDYKKLEELNRTVYNIVRKVFKETGAI